MMMNNVIATCDADWPGSVYKWLKPDKSLRSLLGFTTKKSDSIFVIIGQNLNLQYNNIGDNEYLQWKHHTLHSATVTTEWNIWASYHERS